MLVLVELDIGFVAFMFWQGVGPGLGGGGGVVVGNHVLVPGPVL